MSVYHLDFSDVVGQCCLQGIIIPPSYHDHIFVLMGLAAEFTFATLGVTGTNSGVEQQVGFPSEFLK
jgi:hypothetical protein